MKKREIKIFGNENGDGYIHVALDYRNAINDSTIKDIVNLEPSEIIESGKKLVEEFEYMSDSDWKEVTYILQRYDIKYNFKKLGSI